MNLEQSELSAGTAPQPNRGKNMQHRISNIEHSAPNIEQGRSVMPRWELDVGCWFPPGRGQGPGLNPIISGTPHLHRRKKKSGACCSGTNPACCNEWILARACPKG